MEESYEEFLARIQKRGSNPHKISHCFGSRDAWKWVRKNKWKALDGKQYDKLLYSKIINCVNKILVEMLLDGHIIEFPYQMGCLSVSSLPSKVYYQSGEIVTNYRTDWKKTLTFWYEDKEARKTHNTIKRIQKDIYFIRYLKTDANYRNKRFYSFRANRSLGRRLGREVAKRRVSAMQYDF